MCSRKHIQLTMNFFLHVSFSAKKYTDMVCFISSFFLWFELNLAFTFTALQTYILEKMLYGNTTRAVTMHIPPVSNCSAHFDCGRHAGRHARPR
jgi:hypothetical protein